MANVGNLSFMMELWQARFVLLQAAAVTIEIAFGALILGLVFGFLGALCLTYGPFWIRVVVKSLVVFTRGIPPLIALFFIFYGGGLLVSGMTARTAGILALSIFATAQIAETFRGALQSIPQGQLDAAKAIGLPFPLRLLDVVLPLAFRRALPSLVNTGIEMVKASTLVAAIGGGELLLTGQEIAARSFHILQIYLLFWAFYLAINFMLSALGRWLEERLRYAIG
jgi:polar amino acid transport system permease protein